MKVIAIVGAGSGSGKTSMACRLLSSIPGLAAVKFSPREGEPTTLVWGGGEDPGKDTAAFIRAGAGKVARIGGSRLGVLDAWGTIHKEFSSCRAVVAEGRSSLKLPEELYPILVVDGRTLGEYEKHLFSSMADTIAIIVMNVRHSTEFIGHKSDLQNHFPSSEIFTINLASGIESGFNPLLERVKAFVEA